ncbi:hypothetical protein CAJAP_00009 [Camponotus japonicus]
MQNIPSILRIRECPDLFRRVNIGAVSFLLVNNGVDMDKRYSTKNVTRHSHALRRLVILAFWPFNRSKTLNQVCV